MTEPTRIIRNVRPLGAEAADIVIAGSTIAAVVPTGTAPASTAEIVDGAGMLALPGFINTHAHIDKSWWHEGWVPYHGSETIPGQIAFERENRDAFGIPSVNGVEAVMREFLRHGTTATRSHVDVDLGIGLRGIEDVLTASDNLGGALEVEIVAFPQDGVIRRPGVAKLLEEATALGVRNIGGIDPATIDRDPVAQLDTLFDIVDRTGVGLDIHLHDRNALGRFQIELIIERTLAIGAQGRVNIAHGFALGDLPWQEQRDLVPLLAEAGISWTTRVPVGSQPLPWREMRDAGMGVGLGTDGIRDLWNPWGDGDMMRIALTFAQLHAMRSDEELALALSLATTEAAGFVHRDQHDLSAGARADIVLVDALNVQDALVRDARRETVVAGGRVVVQGAQVLI